MIERLSKEQREHLVTIAVALFGTEARQFPATRRHAAALSDLRTGSQSVGSS